MEIFLAILAVPVILVIGLFFYFVPIGLWISAISAGTKVSIFSLIGMRFRRVSPYVIVPQLIRANKAGLSITGSQLESHYLSGGRIKNVIDAIIAAERANIELNWDLACAIDLAGRNVLEAVNMSVTPVVIQTPVIAAVALDGIELKVTAKVTVKADIARLVGGAGEDTILARVGEGIVTSIGSAQTYKAILENPDMISNTVLKKGLDNGTAFSIISIDIADIDMGRNVGATLQIEQAEADKKIAQAKAEERRALAVAREQEMKAYTEEMRAKVVEAEAAVPASLAKALENSVLTAKEYYELLNIDADTDMKKGIAQSVDPNGNDNMGEAVSAAAAVHKRK